jgi:hypothetical protein
LQNCHDIGDLAIKMVQTEMNKYYKFVYCLVELALFLLVATAIVERIFTSMKIIKTKLRNKIGNHWLNHRMICYNEREIFASIEGLGFRIWRISCKSYHLVAVMQVACFISNNSIVIFHYSVMFCIF